MRPLSRKLDTFTIVNYDRNFTLFICLVIKSILYYWFIWNAYFKICKVNTFLMGVHEKKYKSHTKTCITVQMYIWITLRDWGTKADKCCELFCTVSTHARTRTHMTTHNLKRSLISFTEALVLWVRLYFITCNFLIW